MQALLGEQTALAELLLIDDSPEFINYVTRLLALEAPNLAAATWDYASGAPPMGHDWSHTRLILLDYRLGRESGLAWLEALRKHPGIPPIAMVTASRDDRIREAALCVVSRCNK